MTSHSDLQLSWAGKGLQEFGRAGLSRASWVILQGKGPGFMVFGFRRAGVQGLQGLHAPETSRDLWVASCAQRTSLMLPKKPSKLGFLQHSHPL